MMKKNNTIMRIHDIASPPAAVPVEPVAVSACANQAYAILFITFPF